MKKLLHQPGRGLNALFEEQKPGKKKNTISVLDGVRACAIIFVIVFHINRTTGDNLWDWHAFPLASSISTAGASGVTLFFVLSGFLLFLSYSKALLTNGRWPLARTFYLRRALRIMPGYYISLFVLILLMAPQYFQPVSVGNPGQFLAFLVDSSQRVRPPNLVNLGLFLTFFMDSSRQTFRQLDGPFWTLATEWQYYMILPLLALGILLLVKRVHIRRRLQAVTLCLLGIIAAGLAVRLFGLYFQQHPTATFLVPRPVLNGVLFFSFGILGKYTEDFAVGMLACLYYVYAQSLPPEHTFVRTLRRLSLWLGGIGMGILFFSALWHFQAQPGTPAWPFLNPIVPYFDWLNEMLLSIGYALCILAILFGPQPLQRIFAWKPLRWIGMISYSLYIWHLPLIVLFQRQILNPLFPDLNKYVSYSLYWLWLLIVIVPLCILYYALVEQPGMKLGARWNKALEGRYRASHQESKPAPSREPAPSPAEREAIRS